MTQLVPSVAVVQPWWQVAFADPALAALVEQAGAALPVAIAERRREGAFARLQAAQSALSPILIGGLVVSGRADDSGETGAVGGQFSVDYSRNLAGAERLRAQSAAAAAAVAEATVSAARLDSRTLAGRLIAAALTAQAQQAAARRSLVAAEESLNLATTRARAGLDTALAVAQARAARDRAAGVLPSLDQAQSEARLGLEALLGRPVGSLAPLFEGAAAFESRDLSSLVDAPVAVLSRRPDIRIALARLAEADLAAAAAQADRWPTISVASVLGLTAADQGPDGGALSLSGTLLQPLFDAGRRTALADAARAEAEAARLGYADAVSAAIGDVETALSRMRLARQSRDAQAAAAASAAEQVRLARERYTSGLTSFLDVAAADTALAAAEADLARAEGVALDAAVLLAASLGLGADG
jgi:outer membrane protein TolC